MKIAFLTNEYPPNVYGGAGVHVEYLSRELSRAGLGEHQVELLCFGKQMIKGKNLNVTGLEAGIQMPYQDPRHEKLMDTLTRNIAMSGFIGSADIVHCHTWYTHLAGCILKQLLDAPLVLTTHSLEPHRPWKEEQLGKAYEVSTWLESTAYRNADGVIAVSESMRRDVHQLYGVPLDIIKVIPNGIDLEQYRSLPNPELLARFGIDADLPMVLFVGRITRQKGLLHLINALKFFKPGTQVVLCAGAPDTPEIGREIAARVEAIRNESQNPVIWISEMLSKEQIISLYSHAAIFICPSVYEPFGIINLEAMACGTPVVASAVGGIPEVVVPGETGTLVSFEPSSKDNFEPLHPEKFSRALAQAVNELLDAPEKLQFMSIKARERVEKHFSWTSVAKQTLQFYKELTQKHEKR